ncbi:MAG: TetR/AcrR family transcriptional regulator, partial [Actinobacteria bacterium]|nr:TetR/AcrR family transcriptional regulator [Actinomycetota bacterium]
MDRHPTAQKILDEAVRMIDERGEAGVRIQDIQDACDVTAPSIYHFFGNRDGL